MKLHRSCASLPTPTAITSIILSLSGMTISGAPVCKDVCVCMCVCVYVCVCMCVCVYVCMCVCVCVCSCMLCVVHTCACVMCVRMHECMCVCECVHMWVSGGRRSCVIIVAKERERRRKIIVCICRADYMMQVTVQIEPQVTTVRSRWTAQGKLPGNTENYSVIAPYASVLSPWWEHLKTDSCTAFSPLLLRGVPVGVVYAGNNVIFKTRWFPPRSRTDSNGRHTVRSRNAFDDENARPVPYSQVVFPVQVS